MNQRYTFLLLLSFSVFIACKRENNVNTDQQHAIVLRDSLNELCTTALDKGIDSSATLDAKQVWDNAQYIAAQTKGDTVSAGVLFKAGALLQAINNIPKAIGTWGLIVEYYPKSKYAPLALFQQGIAFDNDLHDKDNAGRYYQKFLTLYPKHQLAGQVKQLIQMMGKSDAELIREFEAKNKKQK